MSDRMVAYIALGALFLGSAVGDIYIALVRDLHYRMWIWPAADLLALWLVARVLRRATP